MGRRLSNSDVQLMRQLRNNVDAFERNNADGDAQPMVTTGMQVLSGKGNPSFDALFDLNILIRYFTVSSGAFTLRTAAYILTNAATLATQLAFFVFGQMDFEGGYKKIKSQFPLNIWQYGAPFIYGKDDPWVSVAGVVTQLDGTANAQLQDGDMVQSFSAVVGGVNYVALVVIRCVNVAYGTLLSASSSDSYVVNRVRYILRDTSPAGLEQYAQAIYWFKQSLFGKFDQDSITPNSQKPPDQFQAGIVDVGMLKNITKEIAFGSYLNYDCVSLQWSIFVKTVNKLPGTL